MTYAEPLAGTSAGILVDGGHAGWWAWAGLRIVPQVRGAGAPAAATGYYGQNQVLGNVGKLVQAGNINTVNLHGVHDDTLPPDRAWLRALWEIAAPSGAVVELRQLHGSGRVECFLLLRVAGTTRTAALESAWHLRERLTTTVPGHVVASPVVDDVELGMVLQPFHPDPDGLLEIRKPIAVGRAARAGVGPWLAAVAPWRGGSWRRLLDRMSTVDSRVMLSIGLLPYRIGEGARRVLADRAGVMAALAEPAASSVTVYGGARPPDQFAVAARSLAAGAVARYAGDVFQVRVSLAADRRLREDITAAVVDGISPSGSGLGLAGASAVAVRPAVGEWDTAWSNIAALNFDPLPVAQVQGHSPDAVGDVERLLGAIADVDEAAAAFRLPFPVLG